MGVLKILFYKIGLAKPIWTCQTHLGFPFPFATITILIYSPNNTYVIVSDFTAFEEQTSLVKGYFKPNSWIFLSFKQT